MTDAIVFAAGNIVRASDGRKLVERIESFANMDKAELKNRIQDSTSSASLMPMP